MRRKTKIMALLILTICIAGGGVFIWAVDVINKSGEFMYIPDSFNDGDNAYDRGWQNVGQGSPTLQFTRCTGCEHRSALKLTTTSISQAHAVRFDFTHSDFVVTTFSLVVDGATGSQLAMNAVILQDGNRVAVVPMTDITHGAAYRIVVNASSVGYAINNGMVSAIPISGHGMDGIVLEVTGVSGVTTFVSLHGQRLVGNQLV